MNKPQIKIIKDENNPEPVELLAKSIIEVAEGFEKLKKSKLTQRAIIVLLQDGIGPSKINKQQIALVLDNLPRLKAWYIKD
jgi:hypothetical protein